MKYNNGTCAEITNQDMAKLESAGIYVPESELMFKTGAYSVLIFDRGEAYAYTLESKVDKVLKHVENVHSPENIGLSKLPDNYSGQSLEAGMIAYIDEDYFKKLTSIKPENLYNGAVPVMILSAESVMLLEGSGVTLTLPITTKKLMKHATMVNKVDVDNFMFLPED